MKKQNPNHKRRISRAECTEHYQWSLLSILIFGVFLSSCSVQSEVLTPAIPASKEFTYDQYEVITGITNRQTVLTGFLLDGPIAELVVAYVDENGDNRLRIYAFSDSNWVPKLDATLHPEVLFVDVANIGGRDQLVTYEHGHLNWFDPESVTERPLVAVISNFNPPRSGEIPHVDVTQDVNADGRDDLVVPDIDGFWVFIQMEDGAFAFTYANSGCHLFTDIAPLWGADT